MRYRIQHVTTYTTSEPVSVCHNTAHLKPRPTVYQSTVRHGIAIDPVENCRTEHVDAFGNPVTNFSFNEGYDTLRVEATNVVKVGEPVSPLDFDIAPWEAVRDGDWQTAVWKEAADGGMGDPRQFLTASPRVHPNPDFADYARQSFTADRPLAEALQDLTTRIFTEFEYSKEATTVSTPNRRVFEQRAGVCQDFAHLQIAMLRSLGLPACYVSGYIRSYPAKGQEHLVGTQASHAWVSVYTGQPDIGDDGWIDTDPTNNKFLTDEYVTLARGRDYSDVAPLRGIFMGSGSHDLKVEVDVRPIDEPGPVDEPRPAASADPSNFADATTA